MVTKEFKLPDVGEGVAEGEIVSWLVSPGDPVTEDQPVAEVETDKALVEIPSPYNGTVKELLAEEGEIVPVGEVIITFELEEKAVAGSVEEADVEPEVAESAEAESTEAEPAEAESTETESAVTETAEEETAEEETAEEETAEGKTEPVAVDSGTSSRRVFASPSARRLAREIGVDLAAIEGSGPGGRVTEGDIREDAAGKPERTAGGDAPEPEPKTADGERKPAVTRREGASPSAAPTVEPADRDRTLATPATRKVAREEGVDLDEVPTDETREGEAFVTAEQVRAYAAAKRGETDGEAGVEVAGSGEPAPREETIPYRGVRRTIGEKMAESKYTAPHVTHHDTAEVSALVAAREGLKPRAAERDVKLTYMPFLIKAVVAALKRNPVLNSELREDDEEIVLKNYYNVGIAVATDAGLMVPVVENADEKGLLELSREVNDLATRARERTLKPAEMKGSTFTITNFGAIGGEYATPIINYPETAVLGFGAIEERPVVEDGEVVASPTLPLSLSIDHRVIDGAEGARFTNDLIQYLQEPALLLLE